MFIFVLLFQCKTTQLESFKNSVRKSTSINFLNPQEFNRSRELMLNTFSVDVMENDSVIIMEYFPDGLQNYYCTIYESKDKIVRRYRANVSIKKGAIYVDSLSTSNVKDEILPMIIDGKLDEVKKRGEKTTLTPASTLIINILTKDEDKADFKIKTVRTRNFLP